MKLENLDDAHRLLKRHRELVAVRDDVDGSPNTIFTLKCYSKSAELRSDQHFTSIKTFIGIAISEIEELLVALGVEIPEPIVPMRGP